MKGITTTETQPHWLMIRCQRRPARARAARARAPRGEQGAREKDSGHERSAASQDRQEPDAERRRSPCRKRPPEGLEVEDSHGPDRLRHTVRGGAKGMPEVRDRALKGEGGRDQRSLVQELRRRVRKRGHAKSDSRDERRRREKPASAEREWLERGLRKTTLAEGAEETSRDESGERDRGDRTGPDQEPQSPPRAIRPEEDARAPPAHEIDRNDEGDGQSDPSGRYRD